MPRKANTADSGPSKAYLISFGDTMTALLAFFIVLNSLAEEQSGANLHRGTGSFVQALQSMGLPGFFQGDNSPQSVQLEEWGPLYLPASESNEPGPGGDGSDEMDRRRIIDFEIESYHRFLNEIARLHTTDTLPDVVAEVTFDDLQTVPAAAPLLGAGLRESLRQIAPQIHQTTTRVEIVVWATTPSASAWERAVSQANQIRQEAIRFLRLDARTAERVIASARVWISSTTARPGSSIVLRRVDPTTLASQ